MYEQRQTGTFDIGRVIQRTFGAIGRNFAVFFGLSLLFIGAPAALLGLAQSAGDPEMLVVVGLLGGLLSIVTTYILQAALVHGTVADLNGRRATVAASLSVGTRSFWPVLGISILFGLALFFGFILLIIPGLIMLTVWLVAVPSEVIERRGVFASFQRSRDLTRGNRWPVFGLVVIYIILFFLLSGGTGVLAAAAGSSDEGVVLNAILLPLIQAVSGMIGAVGVAATYVELRQAKEGAGPEDLAAVFA